MELVLMSYGLRKNLFLPFFEAIMGSKVLNLLELPTSTPNLAKGEIPVYRRQYTE